MKRVKLGILALIVFLLCLLSCVPAISPEEHNELREELDNAHQRVDELTESLSALSTEYDSLQADYDSLRELFKQSNLDNPSWSDLRAFLQWDDTEARLYIEDSFDCSGFAITLRDHAWLYSIRCAYVEVSFSEGAGHALNAFETSDKGLIYVDTTRADQVAYIQINQPYGTIHLDGVKFEYIACDREPAEFWTLLTYVTNPDPFSYDYYIDYQRRSQFYRDSVGAYNKAVDEYNEGNKKWTSSQLARWLNNLEALEQDLGSIFYEPMGVIKSVEAYWN